MYQAFGDIVNCDSHTNLELIIAFELITQYLPDTALQIEFFGR